MSKEGAARRNRAVRKIRKCRNVAREIIDTIEEIMSLLNHKTDYQLAWPSAQCLADRLGKNRRTILWHVSVIKKMDLFTVHQFRPREAKTYTMSAFAFDLKLERCSIQAPNLFEVNPRHPIWNTARTLPSEIEDEWVDLIAQMKSKRNSKTTSRLASAAIAD